MPEPMTSMPDMPTNNSYQFALQLAEWFQRKQGIGLPEDETERALWMIALARFIERESGIEELTKKLNETIRVLHQQITREKPQRGLAAPAVEVALALPGDGDGLLQLSRRLLPEEVGAIQEVVTNALALATGDAVAEVAARVGAA